jgi:hypothetical protein
MVEEKTVCYLHCIVTLSLTWSHRGHSAITPQTSKGLQHVQPPPGWLAQGRQTKCTPLAFSKQQQCSPFQIPFTVLDFQLLNPSPHSSELSHKDTQALRDLEAQVIFVCVWWEWGLVSGLYACRTGHLPLESHFALVILEMGVGVLQTICPGCP